MSDPAARARPRPVGWAPRPYRPGDEQQILLLYPLAFQGLQRSEAYWQWKFHDNPAGQNVFVAEDAAGRIRGLIAGVPARAQAEGRPVIVSQVAEVMVDPGFRQGLRRGGVYVGLLAAVIGEATRRGAGLIFGVPNQDSDRVVQALFGGRVIHQVTRVVRPVAGGQASPRAWLARSRYTVRPAPELGVAEPLWQRCRSNLPLATIRDAGYLTWRYLRCPHVRYHTYVAWDRWRDRPAGLSVLRMGWEDQPVCAIVDWLLPRGETAPAVALLAHAEAQARQAGLREVAAWFPPDSPEQRWILAQGYRREPTRYPMLTIIPGPELTTDWVARHWYYTMGDSDIF